MKTNLNSVTREFIITTFFKTPNHPNWEIIAEILLNEGECVVAGEEEIWCGGIGNFIRQNKEPKAVGCIRYYFDIKGFLESAYFQDVYFAEIQKREEEVEEMRDNIDLLKRIHI